MTILLAMAGLGFAFNAGEHNERQIDALPAGWYQVQIVNSEVKPTKTPGGARLNLQFKVLSGDFAGRVLFGGYNVQNPNPVAVQIAMEELAELSRAVGVPVWNDTQQLHAIPFNLKVKVVAATEQYPEKNEPQQYKHIQDMDRVVYATKADIKKGPAPVGNAFSQPQPQAGFGQQPQQQPQQQPGWATQQQPQQQPAQTQQQQPQQGNVNFQQAAQQQPWGAQQQQPQQQPAQTQQPVQQQQQQQQPQQAAQQAVQQQQPVQQQPVEGEFIPAQNTQQQTAYQPQQQQPAWAQTQVKPGTEQPQQVNNQQQVQEPADEIAQTAQSQTPPWKMQAQE